MLFEIEMQPVRQHLEYLIIEDHQSGFKALQGTKEKTEELQQRTGATLEVRGIFQCNLARNFFKYILGTCKRT